MHHVRNINHWMIITETKAHEMVILLVANDVFLNLTWIVQDMNRNRGSEHYRMPNHDLRNWKFHSL